MNPFENLSDGEKKATIVISAVGGLATSLASRNSDGTYTQEKSNDTEAITTDSKSFGTRDTAVVVGEVLGGSAVFAIAATTLIRAIHIHRNYRTA